MSAAGMMMAGGTLPGMLAQGIAAHRGWIALALAALVLLALAPLYLSPFHVRVAQLFLLSAALAIAWSLLGGFAGYWSFGHTAFIGLGAFVAGLVETGWTWPSPALAFAVGLLAGALACALLAGLIAYPILRLRGIYFAIAMLGVAQVLGELNNSIDAFKGTMGIVLPQLAPRAVEPATFYYYLLLVAAAVTLAIGFAVKVSRLGYGLLSIREDEDTARMLGVPTERYKIQTFVLSAVLTGVLGIIYAHSLGFITAGSVYRTDFSLNMIVYALLGGMGTLIGPVIGAGIMVVLTQIVLGRLLDTHMFITGALLVILVMLAPRGIVGFVKPILARWRGGFR
ncbi:MAG: branched-chain amino acid ABC transporter permease [Alphaproteobacteria bacterium]|nr:branched-chain amino acid ABC transporter permease [Alphaproteobacteria bacterium]